MADKKIMTTIDLIKGGYEFGCNYQVLLLEGNEVRAENAKIYIKTEGINARIIWVMDSNNEVIDELVLTLGALEGIFWAWKNIKIKRGDFDG